MGDILETLLSLAAAGAFLAVVIGACFLKGKQDHTEDHAD